MNAESNSASIAMMREFLNGKTHAAIAEGRGISRSLVGLRINALARELQLVVGVVGVDTDAVPNADFIRLHHTGYLEALDHYCPSRKIQSDVDRKTISDDELNRLAARTLAESQCKRRDVALLLILFATAAKPLEIARLEVRDYLNPDGTVRVESVLRKEVAINGTERPLFFASAKANAAIDDYLEERRRRGQGIAEPVTPGCGLPASSCAPYRGLDPASKLFLGEDGSELPIRIETNGMRRQHFCTAILDIYRKIFARSEVRGISALSARRTVACKLQERGVNMRRIGTVLGLKDVNSVRKLLAGQEPSLTNVVRDLI